MFFIYRLFEYWIFFPSSFPFLFYLKFKYQYLVFLLFFLNIIFHLYYGLQQNVTIYAKLFQIFLNRVSKEIRFALCNRIPPKTTLSSVQPNCSQIKNEIIKIKTKIYLKTIISDQRNCILYYNCSSGSFFFRRTNQGLVYVIFCYLN